MGGLAAVFSIQALPIERCDELPAVSGAYVVVSRQGVVLGGYARDIYAEFQGNLANIYEFFGDYGEEQQESSAQYLVFWMGCSDELSLRSFRSLLIHSVQRVIIEGQLREFLAKF
jgi:hypothetical protein